MSTEVIMILYKYIYRSDLEKYNKEVRSVSTEVKYLDSTIKKGDTGQKAEISAIK